MIVTSSPLSAEEEASAAFVSVPPAAAVVAVVASFAAPEPHPVTRDAAAKTATQLFNNFAHYKTSLS
ncbi:hypothetical protein [Lacrimispora xylanisolvens]|uniref:hypothetical protein n=1 Tax=Lacrimispora xylanisolvens TaxID=384636 RepID=UPI0024027786